MLMPNVDSIHIQIAKQRNEAVNLPHAIFFRYCECSLNGRCIVQFNLQREILSIDLPKWVFLQIVISYGQYACVL